MEALTTFPTALGPNDADDGDEGRRLRGMAIAANTSITKTPVGYKVPSQSGNGDYVVSVDDGSFCTCPDYARRGQPCKHIYTVFCTIQREELEDGSIRETTQAVRVKYTQDWPTYNAAQMNEGEHFATLYRSLCDAVRQPELPRGRGRPTLPLSDVLYGIGIKVYSEKSGRRAMSDIKSAKAQGLLDKVPSFASVARYLKNPDLTPLLESMITVSALPLRTLESHFAQDSTGFSSSSYTKWREEKWGKEVKRAKWGEGAFHCWRQDSYHCASQRHGESER